MASELTINSPVTGKPGVKPWNTIAVQDILQLYKDDLGIDVSPSFGDLEEVQILECEKTGYKFYYPYSTAGDAKFYEALQMIMDKREMYYRPWGYDHQYAFDRINEDEKILDVGCGSGNFLTRIAEKTTRRVGLEFNNAAIEKCRKAGLEVYPDSIEAHAEKFPGAYDVVCIFQVLEHVYDIEGFLKGAVKALRPGGRLIIGVPNNEPYYQRFNKHSTLNLPPHHMGLWNGEAFRRLQDVFNITLTDTFYDAKGRWTLDAYFRAKLWWKIKSGIHRHTLVEKLKMLAAAPLTVPAAWAKKLTSGINGGYVAVTFENKTPSARG